MRARRYAGSKDRRAIRGHVYDAVRLVRSAPPSGRAAMLALANRDPALAALFDGSPYCPDPLATDEPPAATRLPAPALTGPIRPPDSEEPRFTSKGVGKL